MNALIDPGVYPIQEGKIPNAGSKIEIKKTICDICNPHSHCGIDAYVKDGVVIKVEGTLENAHSGGTLCAKGAANRQYIYHKDRLLTPLLRKGEPGSGEFEQISWERALDIIGEKLNAAKATTGPESVAFFVGYPKHMRPFVQRLCHRFGSPNFLTESSTCHTATLVAAKLNYGYFGPPDLANSKCLLIWSANPFYSNTSGVRKLLDRIDNGLKVIVVSPMVTPTTSHADIHICLRPGTDGALALGMAHVIINERLYDQNFVQQWALGFDEFRTYVNDFTPQRTEEITGVPAETIIEAARLYGTTRPAALMTSASPTVHHTNGLQNHRAITLLIGLTGNFDVKGGNHVLPPGFVEVNNGARIREHDFEQSRTWEEMAPRVGLDAHPVWCKIISQANAMHLPFQIHSEKPYPIKALVGFGLNYKMWPGSDFMLESLKKLDFLVDVDLFMTDTAKYADIVLPACSSFERSEFKMYTNRFAIMTEPVIEPLGQSRPDTDIVFDLAKRLTPDDALLATDYETCVDWMLEPSGISVKDIKKVPGGCMMPGVMPPPYRKYESDGFPTPSGKMEFASTILEEAGLPALPQYEEPRLSPVATPEIAENFPLVLSTGTRLPMYVHSRTFRLPWTHKLRPHAMVDMNPKDADERKISMGDSVILSSPRGEIRLRANLTRSVPQGVVSVYHGLPGAEINQLIDPDYRDPISGFPGFKSLLCQITPAQP